MRILYIRKENTKNIICFVIFLLIIIQFSTSKINNIKITESFEESGSVVENYPVGNEIGLNPTKMYIENSIGYFYSAYRATLFVYDFTKPEYPKIITRYRVGMTGDIRDLQIKDDLIFLLYNIESSDNDNNILVKILDISNPKKIKFIAEYFSEEKSPHSLRYLENNHLIISYTIKLNSCDVFYNDGLVGFEIVDISNYENITKINDYQKNLCYNLCYLESSNGYVYLSTNTTDLLIVNITNPNNILEINYNGTIGIEQIGIVDNFLISNDISLNITNPDNIKVKYTYEGDYFAIFGDYLVSSIWGQELIIQIKQIDSLAMYTYNLYFKNYGFYGDGGLNILRDFFISDDILYLKLYASIGLFNIDENFSEIYIKTSKIYTPIIISLTILFPLVGILIIRLDIKRDNQPKEKLYSNEKLKIENTNSHVEKTQKALVTIPISAFLLQNLIAIIAGIMSIRFFNGISGHLYWLNTSMTMDLVGAAIIVGLLSYYAVKLHYKKFLIPIISWIFWIGSVIFYRVLNGFPFYFDVELPIPFNSITSLIYIISLFVFWFALYSSVIYTNARQDIRGYTLGFGTLNYFASITLVFVFLKIAFMHYINAWTLLGITLILKSFIVPIFAIVLAAILLWQIWKKQTKNQISLNN